MTTSPSYMTVWPEGAAQCELCRRGTIPHTQRAHQRARLWGCLARLDANVADAARQLGGVRQPEGQR